MYLITLGFTVGSRVKNPSAMQETWVRFLGQENPLKKGMAMHSNIFLPGEFHGQRTGLQIMGRVRQDLATKQRNNLITIKPFKFSFCLV